MNGELTSIFYKDSSLLAIFEDGEGVASIPCKKDYGLALIRFSALKQLVDKLSVYGKLRELIKLELVKHTSHGWTERQLDDFLDHCKEV